MTRLWNKIMHFARALARLGREAQMNRLSHEVVLFERQVGARQSWC